MRKLFLLLMTLFLMLTFSSCEVYLNEYGTIQCINNSKYPFVVTVKGNTPMTFTMDGKTSTTVTVEVGFYSVHVKQKSGYLLYATENDYEGYVTNGQNMIVSFTD